MSIETYLKSFNSFKINDISENDKEKVLQYIVEIIEDYSRTANLSHFEKNKTINFFKKNVAEFKNNDGLQDKLATFYELITKKIHEKMNSNLLKIEYNNISSFNDNSQKSLNFDENELVEFEKDLIEQSRSYLYECLSSNAKAIVKTVTKESQEEIKQEEQVPQIQNKNPADLPQHIRDQMKWTEIIEMAEENSAHAEVLKLPIDEKKEIQKKEWLKGDGPLTGLCLGLAIDYLLSAELGENALSAPTDEARYWSRAQIPAVDHAAKIFRCSFDDLQEGRHLDLIYVRMMQTAKEKANLSSKVVAAHTPLKQLGGLVNNQQGHLLAILEKPGNASCENHTVYINPTTRIIADYSVVIKVPNDADFGAFVDYYMKFKYDTSTTPRKVTLISARKDPTALSVRKPSFLDRAAQSVELLGMQITSALIHEEAKSELYHGEIPSWI